MAKRRLLQWMRDRLLAHAKETVTPSKEKKSLDAAYAKACGLVLATVRKKFPTADMKVLEKYGAGERLADPKLQFPSGAIVEFVFAKGDEPYIGPTSWKMKIFITDASTALAVEKWETARQTFNAENKKRLDAYKALINGASFVEDLIDVWPEANAVLPAGSPPLPLGPEQIAIIKADIRERKAA